MALGPLVSAAWLESHRPAVRVVDSRWYLDGRSGHAAYLGGHIPGAVWVQLDRELSGPAGPKSGRHPLPSPQAFAAAMSRLGIGDATPVVVYDDAGGSIAARLWWMLHIHGHDVAVLDGGIDAWTGALDTDDVAPEPASPPFTARPWPADRIVDAEVVDSLRARDDALVLDARTASRFANGDPAIDPRPGHIPGARNAPWAGNIDAGTGRIRTGGELRARFDDLGASDARTIVAYCGSGVTACHDLLALTIAGFGDRLALYPGSWSQWGADGTRPAETGPDR
ncbi:MAG TPA: sulfurtransferase [Acidimicrobiales bacterium]|nr:sulfurtransferase [Acidimicrobiales bacterium]